MDNQTTQPVVTQSPLQQPALQPSKSSKNRVKPLLLILLSIVIVAGVGYGIYSWQHKKVISLQKQLNTTSSVNMDSKTHETGSINTATQYLYLYQYGIKIPLTKDIDDLYYSGITQQAGTGVVGGDILNFSTESLSTAEPACSAYDILPDSSAGLEQGASPFGYILVTTSPVPSSEVGSLDEDAGTLVAQANGHYLYYKHPQATCVGADSQQDVNAADQTLLQNQMNAFVNAVKKTQAIN